MKIAGFFFFWPLIHFRELLLILVNFFFLVYLWDVGFRV